MKKTITFMLAITLLLSSSFGFFGGALYAEHAVGADAKIYASIDDTIYSEGGSLLGTSQERIDYAYKVEDRYYNSYKLPQYLSNYTCGIHAGGAIIGRYDKEYEELIPNHAGYYFLGQWLYKSQDAEVNAMFDSLYTRMGATSAGVTLNGYKTGLSSYISSRGRTMVQTKCMSGTTLNSSQYKTAIQNGKLMSIFMDGFAFTTFGEFLTYSNYDNITQYIYAGAHIVAAYGYLDVSYYNAQNQCFRKDSYLYVHSGFSEGLCLVKLNQYCVIDDGYINEIY